MRSERKILIWLLAAGVVLAAVAAVVVTTARTPTTPPVAATPPPPRVPPPSPPSTLGVPCDYPSQVIPLDLWKLTLPTTSEVEATEIGQAQLARYLAPPWFGPTPDCRGIVFRAPVNGATTSGSNYPRSELREMTPDGEEASWSSSSGRHVLVVEEAFTALPKDRPQLVGAQIHGSDDDVVVFRLEGPNLFLAKGDDSHYRLITNNYVLGTPFEARFVVADGVVQVFYNGQPVARVTKEFSDAYFKVGAYTQANCYLVTPCANDNYGETVVYRLSVTHSP